MRTTILSLILLIAGVLGVSAQTQSNNEGSVGYQFLRQDLEFNTTPSVRFNHNTDSHGFNASYARYFAKKGELGNVGVKAEVSANFKDDEAVLATGLAGVVVKAHNAKYVQPFGHVLGGVARQHVTRNNFKQFSSPDYSAAFAIGGGVDFNLAKESRYKLRLGGDILNTGFGGERQNAVRLTAGVVF